MAVYKGYSGTVKAGATHTSVGEVKSFSLTISADVVETSVLGSEYATNQSTLKRWSGSITANFDDEDAGQTLLVVGGSVALELNAGGAKKFSGTAIIGELAISDEVAGIVSASFSYTGSGTLTETDVA